MVQNLEDADRSTQPGIVVGGKSGGILNEVLLDEFREAAKVFFRFWNVMFKSWCTRIM